MSPIIDLQRRVAEVGRIRIGASTPKERNGKTIKLPRRLKTFRITSQDRARLDAIAELYGGTVEPWPERDGHFLVDTTVDELPVVVMPGQAISQWWETWSGGECRKRCDGETETLADAPCSCPADYTERQEAAAEGKACKPTTRLNVILRDVPGVGYWRFESHGFYAAVELAGAAELLEAATARGVLLPARLRFAERTVVRGGQTKRFPVPALDVDVKVLELAALVGRGLAAAPAIAELETAGGPPAERKALEAGSPAPEGAHTPAPARAEGVGAKEALEAANRQTETRRHARSSEPLGDKSSRKKNAPIEVPVDPTVDTPAEPEGDSVIARGSRRTGSSGTAAAPDDVSDTGQDDDGKTAPTAADDSPVEDDVEVVDDADVEVIDGDEPAEDAVDPANPFPGEPYATESQARLVHMRAKKAGLDEDGIDDVILNVTGGRTSSAKLIPKRLVNDVLDAITARAEGGQ